MDILQIHTESALTRLVLGPAQPLLHPLQLLGAHLCLHLRQPLVLLLSLPSLLDGVYFGVLLVLAFLEHRVFELFHVFEGRSTGLTLFPRRGLDARHEVRSSGVGRERREGGGGEGGRTWWRSFAASRACRSCDRQMTGRVHAVR